MSRSSGGPELTPRGHIGRARQIFEDAARLVHTEANSWKHVRARARDPSERRAYVPVSDVQWVIEDCPNVWWRPLAALSRFAGLWVPSEAFPMVWGNVDWERCRLSVPSPKTEGTGKTHLGFPVVPLLRPYLEAAFAPAEEGAVYVLPGGWGGANLRTTLGKVIRRDGGAPWPRDW